MQKSQLGGASYFKCYSRDIFTTKYNHTPLKFQQFKQHDAIYSMNITYKSRDIHAIICNKIIDISTSELNKTYNSSDNHVTQHYQTCYISSFNLSNSI